MADSSEPKHVLVVGAGITGLTVAHELVERGYVVTVVEKTPWNKLGQPPLKTAGGGSVVYPPGPTCNVGGMARTQWGYLLQEQRSGTRPVGPRTLTSNNLEVTPIKFNFDQDDVASFASESDAQDSIKKVEQYLAANPGLSIAAFAVTGKRGESMLACVKKALSKSFAGRVVPNEVRPPVTSDSEVFFSVPLAFVPGEHGFRFFPAFYRHLFDTMQRTPIPRATRGLAEFGATVYDNLVSSKTLRIGLPEGHSFDVNRNPRSLKELRTLFKNVLSALGWTARDIGRLELKMFKFMTSSKERRELEYEHVSWSEFIEQARYSEQAQHDLEWSPQTLGALRGSASDCRTQGDISVQLMLEQLSDGPRFDSLLNGPTSVAWFQHWRTILEDWGVRFVLAELTGFERAKDGTAKIFPVFGKVEADTVSAQSQTTGEDLGKLAEGKDAFVLALDLPSIRRLSDRFLDEAKPLGVRAEDFEKVVAFVGKKDTWQDELKEAAPDLPLQHLSGVQYFFGTDKGVRLAEGHAIYMRAPWGLTSITQSLFWNREIPTTGIISVDVATWNRKYGEKQAWDCNPDELADGIWKQIEESSKKNGPLLPFPSGYHIDEHLIFENGNGPIEENKAPFLVNRTGEFTKRPGRLHPKGYETWVNNWVLAGTYMKTHTRITTMEAANESGRHAVNGLLEKLPFRGERCQIFDPEEHEFDDLATLQRLDAKLLERGKPHFIDILGWDTLPDELLPTSILNAIGDD